MPSQLIISVSPWDVRAALVEDGRLAELYVERLRSPDLTGCIYKGRVLKVLPGMAAAFLDLGLDRPAFLPHAELAPAQAEGLTPGQELLVQITRPPQGGKGARLTGHLSLAGPFLVYLPTASHLGLSRRLRPEEERQRLAALLAEVKPPEGGLIARSAGEGRGLPVLAAERDGLVSQWRQIVRRRDETPAPAPVHRELPLALRLVRDLFSPELDRIIVDEVATFEALNDYLKALPPGPAPRAELYAGQEPLFPHFHLEPDWPRLLAPRVWLPSGGYLLIEATEALTAIDVNTGRFIGRRHLADTILKTNLEAAAEIAWQVRLRNLSGLIVIDFIDMEPPEHRELLHQTLVAALERDRARTTVLPLSALGLVEMTRQRLRDSLEETLTLPCPSCRGRGRVLSPLLLAHDLLRQLAWEAREFPGCRLTVAAHPEVMALAQAEGQNFLDNLRADLQMEIHFAETPHAPRDRFELTRELQKGGKKV